MFKMYRISVLLYLFLQNFMAESAKLTVPRILLPYNTGIPTNYTLEVKEGRCYKWSSSRYDVVSITPLPADGETESCTTKAIVSAISRYPGREHAIVLAEDERTGQLLRCDIVIDKIKTIEIVTTTRVLFLEDAPEVFEVMAKNENNDTFSSLEGVAFQWTLEGDDYSTDIYGVVRFLKFSDSEYKTPPAIEFWERQNLHGSMILMEGSKTGSAKVLVKPMDSAYKDVKPDRVGLVIVANLNLKPTHINLLRWSKIQYHLELIKQGKAYPVTLPSDQYHLEVQDPNIATLDPNTSILVAEDYGSTTVVVKDKYITNKEIEYLPTSAVYVTVPSYMTLTVEPGDRWSLEEQSTYFVSVKIFDRNSYPIHITEDVAVTVAFPTEYFNVISSARNGTYHKVFTQTSGSCQIKAKLSGIKKDGVWKSLVSLETSQDVTIYEKIKIHPEITLLPWDPVVKPSYTINLKATGGTGSYQWASNQSQLASVSGIPHDSQKARVKTFGKGEANIRATDSHISLFTATAVVSVQSAVGMKLLPKEVEVHVDETLKLPLALYGRLRPEESDELLFRDCSQVSLNVDIDEIPKFEYLREDPSTEEPHSCRSIHLRCLKPGYNRIKVRYDQGGSPLQDAVIVGCCKMLRASHPKVEVVVSLGSSSAVVFEGGPRPWVTCKGNHFASLSSDNTVVHTSAANTLSDSTDAMYIHQAVCKGYGESNVQLSVGNKPCLTNLHPLNNTASTKVVCALPQTVIIKPVSSTVTDKKCPTPSDDMVAVHNLQDVVLELIVKDSLGRTFYNISSLDVKWSLSDDSLATLDSYEGFQTKYQSYLGYKTVERNYQELHPSGLEGILRVSAIISGYKPDVLLKQDINEKPELRTAISHSLNLNLVEEVEVVPKKISVFNNPANKGYLNVTKGSGHFHVEISDPKKARVVYFESSRQIEITPLDSGSFTVTVADLCVPTKLEVVAQVHVYGISSILLDVVDKVELGKSINVAVEVLNEDKKNIPASIFSLMNLKPVIGSDIISIRLLNKISTDQNHAIYQVSGLSLGQTNLKFITTSSVLSDQQYESEAYPIQVFPPLRVNPNNMTLVVGSTFQVVCLGGPHPQSSIEYSVEEPEKAIVSTGGRVEGKKLGKTVLVASSVGYDKNGQRVVYSKDKAVIHIISLQKIKIHSPLTRMIAGSEMPVYAVGITEEETPFTFGSASPGIEFSWSISNEKVVIVNDVYKEVGMQESKENNFCARIKAEQDGHATLRLEVLIKDYSMGLRSRILSDEVQIQVFKKLKLTNPEYEDGMILLSPHSELKLRCNRFLPAVVSYTISSVEGDSVGTPVVSVDRQGVLTASSKVGSAVLTVIAREEFGVTQHLTAIVKVEEVAYMMLKPLTKIRTKDWPLVYVPVGFSVPFVVTYHDNVGRVFDAARSQLKFRANRLDLARISTGAKNNTLVIQALNVGFTVLKVWDAESFVSPDFIKISAGVAIDPADAHVVVGDVVCFGSPLLTQEGHLGIWTSDNSLVSIHPASGGAVALSPGSSTITYSLSSSYVTSAQITVLPVDKMVIVPGNLRYVTNVQRSKPYRVKVVLESSSIDRPRNVIGKNCSSGTEESMALPSFRMPFTCEVLFNSTYGDVRAFDVFDVEGGFDIVDGLYYCSITVKKKNVFPIEVSALETEVIISVIPAVSGISLDFSSEPLSLPFLPAFTVNEDKLILHSYHLSSTFSITANAAVQECIEVKPSNKNFLDVLQPIKRDSSLVFQVRLVDAVNLHPDDLSSLHIDIVCQKTKQQERIIVHVKFHNIPYEGGQCLPLPSPTYNYYDWQSLIWIGVLFFFILLIIVLKNAFTKRGTVTNQPVFANSVHNGSFTITPHRMSLSPSPRSLSSHTPSPDVVFETLGKPTQMWSIDNSGYPNFPRRRTTNVFRTNLDSSR